MILCGICSKAIEDIEDEILNIRNDVEILTVFEYLKQKENFKDKKVILVDNIAKLLAFQDINIIDTLYYNQCWIKQSLDLNKIKDLEARDLKLQFKYTLDYDLADYSFITHMKEFNSNPYSFCKKLHNILTKTNKESIHCADRYKILMKEKILNKEMSILYDEFLNKKRQEYPILFKYMKYMIESNYGEKDKKLAEKEGAE